MSPDFLIPIVALLLPVFLVFIHKHYRYKEKLLAAQANGSGPLLLPAGDPAVADKRLLELEERVQNLESIIVAMDTELGVLPERAARDEVRRLRGATPAPPAARALGPAPQPEPAPAADAPGSAPGPRPPAKET